MKDAMILLVFAALCFTAMGAPNGPPLAACGSMRPEGHPGGGFTSMPLGYSISVGSNSVTPGSQVPITVSHSSPTANFRGVFIQVRSNNVLVGGFNSPQNTNFKLVPCSGIANSAFGHANRQNKGRSVTATWTAPPGCSGTYTIMATVVVQTSQYQTGLTRTFVCASAPPATNPPVVLPPATNPPVVLPPATNPPVVFPPATNPPVVFPPATNPPVVFPPATNPPIVFSPATNPPVVFPPATNPPVVFPPATNPPVVFPPATVSSGQCKYSQYNKLPNNYRTGFEETNFNGWMNKYTPGQNYDNYNNRYYNNPYYDNPYYNNPYNNPYNTNPYNYNPNNYNANYNYPYNYNNPNYNTPYNNYPYNNNPFLNNPNKNINSLNAFYNYNNNPYNSPYNNNPYNSPYNNKPYDNFPNNNNPYYNNNNYPAYNSFFPRISRRRRRSANSKQSNNPYQYPSQGAPYVQNNLPPQNVPYSQSGPISSNPRPRINRGWRRNMGATLTQGTGPLFAADGNYYMYLEADYYRPGDYVTLYTRNELRGCFCVHFKYHMNVNNLGNQPSRHTLSVRTNNAILWSSSTPSNEWKDAWVQVDTMLTTRIRIIATRGANNRGDVAIDKIGMRLGQCTP